ncbi:GntR family transcriptional regulator [Pseudomonas sp. M47T1]|uniref:GntR family transcriptional regulator n=1 Tax=unclassified Pseudomonas TaxID=196821 RepID=UPI0002607B98|nr:GntR family transcriptional regulator [Pseudomonas sp. M47T1]EIK94093.1 GntR family transcriptional regulator [Pseudomonas sp. M47T1]
MVSVTVTAKQLEVTRIVDVLSRAIAQQRLRPGTRLVEAQIVDTLQANRNHVQVALQRLAMQHIVTIETNRGAIVSQPTAQEARDVFGARRAIERAVVEAITPEALAANAQVIAEQMDAERQASASGDRRETVRVRSEFHLMLADLCGNRLLREILGNLIVRSSLIVSLYQRLDTPSCRCDDHQAILDALQSGSSESAIHAMLHHLVDLEGQLDLHEQSAPEVNLREALADL